MLLQTTNLLKNIRINKENNDTVVVDGNITGNNEAREEVIPPIINNVESVKL